MADTKKEHYVPRCYLENFEGKDGRIQVFDKVLLQTRNQLKGEIAAENYFYDIDFEKLIEEKVPLEKQPQMKEDIEKIVGVTEWDEVKQKLKPKYLEKDILCPQESMYNAVLKEIIKKSYGGNNWVIENCKPFSENERILMAWFITLQYVRTRARRDEMGEVIAKTCLALAKKKALTTEEIEMLNIANIKADKDFVKLQHNMVVLNHEKQEKMAETLDNHIWVMYVNKTNTPFYTSDNPVVAIPHKNDEYISYTGIASEGVEIAFPISPYLLLAMYERTWHSGKVEEGKFVPIYNPERIDYYNGMQVIHSSRCVYSIMDNFEIARTVCNEHPQIRQSENRIEVT